MRTKYNEIKLIAKKKFKIKEGQKVCDLAKSNPKQLWKSVRNKINTNTVPSVKLTANDVFGHFKSFIGEDPAKLNQQIQYPSEAPFIPTLIRKFQNSKLKQHFFFFEKKKIVKVWVQIIYVQSFLKNLLTLFSRSY